MIDEKKLIEDIDEIFCDDCVKCSGSCRFGELAELIMAQPKVGEWIPCSERLPREKQKCLATGIKGSVFMAEYITGTKQGKPVGMWCRVGGTKSNVIAWMELPDAYKGE